MKNSIHWPIDYREFGNLPQGFLEMIWYIDNIDNKTRSKVRQPC